MPIPTIVITLTVVRSLVLALYSAHTDDVDFCFRSNGALVSGLVEREEILAGTMRSSEPCMIRMSPRFSNF